MLNNILELISESYIFSDKNISVDLDKFESGENNKLLICGLSGSGKTSTGKVLSKKYKIKLIDTDDINKSLSEQYPDDKFPSSYRFKLFKEKLFKLLTSKERLILSGLGIDKTYSEDESFKDLILKQSFIFMGKALLPSTIDGSIRSIKKSDSLKFISKMAGLNLNRFYPRVQKLKKDRLAISNSKISEFSYGY